MEKSIIKISTPNKSAETGRFPINKSPEPNFINANNDEEAINYWLSIFENSPKTLKNYSKEAERLHLWASKKGLALSELTANHLTQYSNFLRNPLPECEWIGKKQKKYNENGDLNINWRAFTGPLSQSSAQTALASLSSLFECLVKNGYLKLNPIVLRNTAGKKALEKTCERYFTKEALEFLFESIEQFPKELPEEEQIYSRARFVIKLLYYTGIRREEAAKLSEDSIYIEDNNYWLKVAGKGTKSDNDYDLVPIPEKLKIEIGRYLNTFEKHKNVDLKEIPLIKPIRNKNSTKFTTAQSVYLMVKKIFKKTANIAKEKDETSHLVEIFESASPHWLRHTSATHQLNLHGDIKTVQLNMRHASINTTTIYLHKDRKDRHAKTEF